MKRNVKRLTLNRETLRSLDTMEMHAAQGGEGSVNICRVTEVNCPVVPITRVTCPSECGQWYCYGVQ